MGLPANKEAITTIDAANTGGPPTHRLKHFCRVASTAARVATPVIAWLA
ncbi:hypothetical protein J2X01_002671 [Arthrobacter ginsengisoli]|uniref:Uncharacterized protein n=1 Tax=Arthrobacter ginsengisoli TaxID=1356565 RepID=A0ABU1UDV6_9MICC|nr:hypothetical protein [Arthrobacter ginsengisoli]MDR7083377.1 hypothetical protein [Arthrobacter ginsengisoli]